MKKCTINIKDKDYELVLTRNSVKWLENYGFSLEEFDRKPVTFYDILWNAGFVEKYPHIHPGLAEKLRESYEEEDGDVKEVIRFIVQEYTTFIHALADTESKKKKKATITEE